MNLVQRCRARLTRGERVWLALLGALVSLILAIVLVVPGELATKGLHSWNLFHYVLGTKYFDELGYFDLYKGLILADAESGQVFSQSGITRDLHTYEALPISEALAQARAEGIRQRFSDARWRELRGDLAAILAQRPRAYWADPIADRGFNPSPVWLLLHKPLLNAVNIQRAPTLLLLCLAQNVLLLLTFYGLWRTVGTRETLLVVAFFYLFFGNAGRWFGGYFSYDWFLLTVWAVVLHRRGKFAAAGACLAYAAMMRGFPGLLALYPAVQWAASLARLRRPDRKHTAFLLSLALTCAALFGATCLLRGGVGAWEDWLAKLSVHRAQHILTESRIGLQYLFVQNYGAGVWEVPVEVRRQLVHDSALAYRVVSLTLVALSAMAMVRRDAHDGLLLGIGVVFFTMVLSRYYFSIGALLLTWKTLEDTRPPNKLGARYLFALLALFAVQALFPQLLPRQRYFCFNLGMTLYFVAVLARFLSQDLAWLRRGTTRAALPPTT
jgi:hypothetical protein